MSTADPGVLPSTDVLHHIVDVHCHPTDAAGGVSTESMRRLAISICAMATMQADQPKVKELAASYPEKVIPCFGYHPWFSHFISTAASEIDPSFKERHYRNLFLPSSAPTNSNHSSSAEGQPNRGDSENELEAQFRALLAVLPDPRPLSSVLAELRENLTFFPNAMLGEVGVDRAFHVPIDYFAHPRVLTEFSIPLEHQVTVLEAQMELAVELGRNVSVHSVKSQQVTVDLLTRMKAKHGERWNRISVDMHSCGLSPQTWRDVEKKHENVFLSLSTVINHNHGSLRALIAACSGDRILAESDYNDINMCTPQTWDMIKIIAEVKGWPVETEWLENEDVEVDEEKWGVVRRLEKNWLLFKNGHHAGRQKKKRNKRRDYDSEGSDVQQMGN
ncbi:hypothetical protein GALMADRAFT_51884 [Galerina marginata CBS 339.88]|uniref:TatD DNase family Scn1 n=1 Tax=Galerina marginata (strain CBS 339.88) TaxID=685588 RepID=A0A067U0C2_GALM3|nr:hypothetical protein GALMADRAFT_51884 [Galerina marginata CBS 339.88]